MESKIVQVAHEIPPLSPLVIKGFFCAELSKSLDNISEDEK